MSIIKHAYCIILLVALGQYDGIAQSENSPQPEAERLKEAAIEIMHDAGTCAFITLDEDGRPRVRAMDPFPPESDLTVWFGSNPKSRKITQIENDPRVSIYYLDSDTSGYVMIYGQAEIIDRAEEKSKHWKEEWKDFYPDYPDDYILIKVEPEWMEIVSPPRHITGDPETWEPDRVSFRSID